MVWSRKLQSEDKLAEARKALEEAAETLPDDWQVLNSLAWFLIDPDETPAHWDPARAISFARRAAKLSKHQNPSVLDTLALAFFKNGELHEAIETQKEALSLMRGKDLGSDKHTKATSQLQRFEAALREKN